MYRLKGCPKCHGDMFLERYPNSEWCCLQCSFRQPLMPLTVLPYVGDPNLRPGGPEGVNSHARSQFYDDNMVKMQADYERFGPRRFYDLWDIGKGRWSKLQKRWREKVTA